MKTFNAPWGRELKFMTFFACFILLGVIAIGINLPQKHPFAKASAIFIPAALLIGSAFFMVRDYTLNQHTLFVRRLGWSSKINLSNLLSATPDADAMSGSIRLAGNGGLFGFTGLFRNRKLGNYRVFGTDPKRCVVLRFGDRIVIVTPENPAEFADAIAKAK
jgi:hypothetical protein